MRTHLLAYINRQTLISARNLLKSIQDKLIFFFAMSEFEEQEPSPPPFDPSLPSVPVSYPIKTLEDLESRSYFKSFHYPFNRASVPLQFDSSSLPDRPRILVCHDMAGGYTDDKWVQGGANADAYAIWHWYLMDVFIYFSHGLVTLPPPCWTNTAHKHGVKVLGTFITEWDEGKIICNTLLATKENAHMYAERLAELAITLGFDGWLINMEIVLELGQIPNLKEFVNHLTQTMHSTLPGSLVIWYDSVTINGDLNWQNQLNDNNKPFFDICDGIFVNYTWQENYPKLSAAVAGDRKFDVYMGIDVFGRNTYGGGQWNTNVALDVLKKDGVSAAIFAPGWVYETKQPPDFQTAQNRFRGSIKMVHYCSQVNFSPSCLAQMLLLCFVTMVCTHSRLEEFTQDYNWWSLVEKSWGILQNYPKILPFYSNFDQGHGYHFSVDGGQVSKAPWCNISCQSFQPYLEFSEDPTAKPIQVLVDFNEASYSGGGNVTFKGTLEDNAYFTTRLFQGELPLGNLPVHFTYSVKLDGSSLIGLSLELSTTNGKTLILLASTGSTLLTMNQFSSKFSTVIMPRRVTKSETAPGWVIQESNIAMDGVIQESNIAMDGYTLTEIHVVCYKSKSEHNYFSLDSRSNSKDASLAHGPSDYYAVLGNIIVKTSEQNSVFPPSASWLVEGQYIKWTSGSQGSKTLSVKIIWKLKDGDDSLFPKYNIYVEKLTKQGGGNPVGVLEGVQGYLGAAQVEAFYVSDLAVPSGTSSLKFIIQVCSVDGVDQKLEDSPSFQLGVEG